MSLTDKFLRWYHRYFTEITWFFIGNLSVQFFNALEIHDYKEAIWLALIAGFNYAIWKRNK